MEVAMRWRVRRLDNGENSILHMAGIKRQDYVPEKMGGPALELQEELLWFECVKSVTKAHFLDHRNKQKHTAEGLFATTNIELWNAARDWLRRTSEGCSVVAVHIATVAFVEPTQYQEVLIRILVFQSFFINLSLWFSQQLMHSLL